jgi:hypothetical protein
VGLNPALPFPSLCVPPSNIRDFSIFGVCPSNKHCPSARCAYAANAVGKDLDMQCVQLRRKLRNTADPAQHSSQIAAVIADNGICSQSRFFHSHFIIIFVYNPNVLCYVVLNYHIPIYTSLHLYLICLLFLY